MKVAVAGTSALPEPSITFDAENGAVRSSAELVTVTGTTSPVAIVTSSLDHAFVQPTAGWSAGASSVYVTVEPAGRTGLDHVSPSAARQVPSCVESSGSTAVQVPVNGPTSYVATSFHSTALVIENWPRLRSFVTVDAAVRPLTIVTRSLVQTGVQVRLSFSVSTTSAPAGSIGLVQVPSASADHWPDAIRSPPSVATQVPA
ncbi:MAG: hypothetical protein BGO96_03255 [Micrococcales bacterium 73-15]|nr:MAG: hypothetical protein BGO96_03255 [Micrococcales bacterium 73-15]